VNAAPPYFVNDIYKRFINPNASPRTYVPAELSQLLRGGGDGVLMGWYVTSVNDVVVWIVSGLWGRLHGLQPPEWYWWRFNGYGYFWEW